MATHLYWRLNITAIDGGTLIQVAEIEYHDSLGGANKSTNADGTASATSEFGAATNAHDGLLNTAWFSAAPTQQIQFIFNTTIDVLEYVIQAQSGIIADRLPKDWTLESSDDGIAWNVEHTVVGETGWVDSEARTFAVASPDTPAIGEVVISGLTPSINVGITLQPTIGSVSIVGNTPIFSGDLVKIGNVSIIGGFPTFGLSPIIKPDVIAKKFICTVTGSADSLPDVEVPISSLTSRISKTGVSTKTVVIPNGVDFADEISARSNGGIIIESIDLFTDGSQLSTIEEEFPIATIRSFQGGRNFSVVIVASKVVVIGVGVIFVLKNITLISDQANGNRRVRLDIENELAPNDVVVLPDQTTLLVNTITRVVNSSGLMYMEIVNG